MSLKSNRHIPHIKIGADLTTRPLHLDPGVTAGVHWGPGTGRTRGGDQEQAAEEGGQGAQHRVD